MDFLDISAGRFMQTYTGRYYKKLPYLVEKADPAIIFDYEYVDKETRSYKHLISNLTDTDTADVAIKTREQLGFKVGEHISLEDGKLCVILQVDKDRQTASKETAYLSPIPFGTEFIMRLVEIENPRGL